MEYSKASGLLIYFYGEAYDWLSQCINSIYGQIATYKEADFHGYSRDYIRNLQTWLRVNRDRAHKLSEELKWTPRNDYFEEFKDRLRHMPEDSRPAFPDPEVTESIYPLLSSVWNRLNQLSNTLDRWTEIDVEAFIDGLEFALHDLIECLTIILEHDICGDGNCPSPEPGAQVVPAEEEADFDGFQSLPTPDDLEDTGEDDLHCFLDLDPNAEASPFNPGETYRTILEALHSAQARIRDCLAVDRPDLPDKSNPAWQRFLECREALSQDIAAAASALDRCYANSDVFEAWLSHSLGDSSCASLESSAAGFLLDAGSTLSEALRKLDHPETTGMDSDEDIDYDDEFEKLLFRELDHKFEKLYGKGDDQSEAYSPAEFEADFADRLRSIGDDLQVLLSALCPKLAGR